MSEGAIVSPSSHRSRAATLRRPPLALVATILALIPAALLAFDTATGNLGVEPVEAAIRRCGRWGLTLLVATLAVTPLRRLTGWNRLIEVRKPLGLAAFLYVCLHLLTYVVIDQWLEFEYILEDILERPYITAGFTAFLLLVPLAATSTRSAIRRLGGRRWQRIHRLIYPAAMLGVLHYYWLVKADTTRPIVYGGILAVLLLARLYYSLVRRTRSGARTGRMGVPAS
ncbi:MAG TPA: protein-methionine-sulfoxide reductase heme-binding subunit MsrQ [Longimicrobiaceae bacterium]|nr:protein-methionine-sulfoxide reductase heme-binding subunit MsrQ [Longimicrobiaceae bacterium]